MESRPHIPYAHYITIWFALVLLTAVTITVAGLHLGQVSILGAILVAAVKGTLVLRHFMHLKYEQSRVFATTFIVTVFTVALLIGFLFWDISYRV